MDERPKVFVAWDHTNREVRKVLDFLTKELNDSWTVEALALDPTPPAGSIWETVRTRIASAHGVLAVMDEPNANVAFELGWAVAQDGKHVRLMCVEEKPPAWMDAALLHEPRNHAVRPGLSPEVVHSDALPRREIPDAAQHIAHGRLAVIPSDEDIVTVGGHGLSHHEPTASPWQASQPTT
jgi:hypothetical protein